MKRWIFAIAASLGSAILTAPANAALLSWKVDYTGWWDNDGGGAISGLFAADETAASDGIISIDEMSNWTWNWSGNNNVAAFSISSKDGGVTDFSPSFFVDGRQNTPIVDFFDADNLDQGSFIGGGGNLVLDLQTLLVGSYGDNIAESLGDPTSRLGKISVSTVPEPSIGLIALLGVGLASWKLRKQQG
ncbi:PEP-CTERM sorting domain-containing protein [Oscillatoria sp. FACHB-1406]|uniref:PEP-CTERM sorting domain-containing protein n=1 Tax=Oscillatoria sp. FACHB-1406 TaxID=2692846 RepID=UPI001684AF68|nr:PEP-CTERM sorting domain-containing protein [Oscillatoria sp. FACHB-1406]MBD2579265.1 PEP-CTERM sorting domain-containing protein [Oscillatoria sp. FACHB-1406]